MTSTTDIPATVRACPCCGLAQHVPAVPAGMRACCARCETSLVKRSVIARSNSRTAAVALAALILYPFAVGLPMLEVERFGHASTASIVEGVASLLASGHWVIGIVVLVCSIVLPLGKLVSLLVLSAGGLMMRHRHRALTYRMVEWTGRWGMLDVLLVALLVAVIKLGDIVVVTPGPAALAFTGCVVLSLLAAACFDPHALWESDG
ncbi:MAG: paraquat-inducible protein A [Planctomycetes bacterium]|nr:paraquat-inducible protein A [Planctomycetota bacterium]